MECILLIFMRHKDDDYYVGSEGDGLAELDEQDLAGPDDMVEDEVCVVLSTVEAQ